MDSLQTFEELKQRIIDLEIKATNPKPPTTTLDDCDEKYRALFEQAVAAIAILDIDGKLVDCNSRAHEMLGVSREKLLSNECPPINADHDLVVIKKHLQEILKKGSDTFETTSRDKDGKARCLLTNSTPIRIKDKIYFQNVSIDITDRKREQDQLKQSHDELKNRVEEQAAELQEKAAALEETNIALRILLSHKDAGKKELEEAVLINVRELINPSLARLKGTKTDAVQESCIEVLEDNLNNIISPLLHRMSLKMCNFTPSEIQITNLIKQGRTSKEIAAHLNLSSKTVDFHRHNIRKKFNLNNEKVNLRSHLLSIS